MRYQALGQDSVQVGMIYQKVQINRITIIYRPINSREINLPLILIQLLIIMNSKNKVLVEIHFNQQPLMIHQSLMELQMILFVRYSFLINSVLATYEATHHKSDEYDKKIEALYFKGLFADKMLIYEDSNLQIGCIRAVSREWR